MKNINVKVNLNYVFKVGHSREESLLKAQLIDERDGKKVLELTLNDREAVTAVETSVDIIKSALKKVYPEEFFEDDDNEWLFNRED